MVDAKVASLLLLIVVNTESWLRLGSEDGPMVLGAGPFGPIRHRLRWLISVSKIILLKIVLVVLLSTELLSIDQDLAQIKRHNRLSHV